jgi:hypothetical protein
MEELGRRGYREASISVSIFRWSLFVQPSSSMRSSPGLKRRKFI